jgi:hypothetical protein
VIVGGLIGIVGGLATSAYLELARRRAERRSLTGAIVGEISALIEISERRHYIEGLRALIAEARAGNDPNAIYWYQFSVRRNPFAVYDANLARLGILRDPLPRLIARFYTQASAILEDIADMREGKSLARNRDQSIRSLEELLQLFEDTRALGRQIIEGAGLQAPSQ